MTTEIETAASEADFHSLIVNIEDRSDSMMNRIMFEFRNGFGASVINGPFVNNGRMDRYEIAVLEYGQLTEHTPAIPWDVAAGLTAREVMDKLKIIATMTRGDVIKFRRRLEFQRHMERLRAGFQEVNQAMEQLGSFARENVLNDGGIMQHMTQILENLDSRADAYEVQIDSELA